MYTESSEVPAIERIDADLVRVQSPLAEIQGLPNDVPKYIYKGRVWSDAYHKRILTHQEIYFPSVPELSDPDDCRFKVNFDLSFPVVFDAFRPLAERSLTTDGIRVNGHNVVRRVEKFYNNMFATDEQKSKWIEDFWSRSNAFFFVFCASKSNTNPEFWSIHVANYQGFVVEFDFEEMFGDFYNNISMGSHVQYFPRTTPNLTYHFPGGTNKHLRDELMVKLASSKYEDFGFEDEYRLLRFDLSDHPSGIPLSKVYQVPKYGIKGIIFGQDISHNDENEIRAVCLYQGLNVRFSKAYRDGSILPV